MCEEGGGRGALGQMLTALPFVFVSGSNLNSAIISVLADG